jgi:hypothetical protein
MNVRLFPLYECVQGTSEDEVTEIATCVREQVIFGTAVRFYKTVKVYADMQCVL